MAREMLLREMRGRTARRFILEEVIDFKNDVEDLFTTFLKEHAYFETVWFSSCMDHEYFSTNVFLDVQWTHAILKDETSQA